MAGELEGKGQVEAALSGAPRTLTLSVNGTTRTLTVGRPPAEVQPSDTLAHTLREVLGLKGTKVSCDRGACGSCTVLLDGKAVLSCMLLAVECGGSSVTTIEGLADPVSGELDPLQQSFIDHTAFQCGYCTPGILMSAKALLLKNPSPTLLEVQEALAGNFCRCITHYHVLEAVQSVVSHMRAPVGQAAPGPAAEEVPTERAGLSGN
jgi:carbon-monoxide dehydrogenase small subunit